jgi:hypothetical protein
MDAVIRRIESPDSGESRHGLVVAHSGYLCDAAQPVGIAIVPIVKRKARIAGEV